MPMHPVKGTCGHTNANVNEMEVSDGSSKILLKNRENVHFWLSPAPAEQSWTMT